LLLLSVPGRPNIAAMKKTKIIATYGPAIATSKHIAELADAGANIFRINCSHGDRDDFTAAARIIRRGVRKAPFPIGLLFDICGPKLRLERFDGEHAIHAGDELTLTTGRSHPADGVLAVNHPGIIKSVRTGERLLIDDGKLAFDITAATGDKVRIRARNEGTLLGGKGINLPDTDIDIPTITRKDRDDIATAVALGADLVALSFVRSGDDIIETRRIIRRLGGRQKIIAKLEKREAIERLDDIMLLADGVMVARGDLGVELPPETVPELQKKIVRLANRHRKPVIVATQMMESMRFSPQPTRAEINDVASAVFDYVDAVMLSAETATGKYPLEVVQTMSRIIAAAEGDCGPKPLVGEAYLIRSEIPTAVAEAVSRAEAHNAVIFAFTSTGFTAELIANQFPTQIIVAMTNDKAVLTRLAVHRGVYSVSARQPRSFEDLQAIVEAAGRKYKLVKPGDTVVVTGGAPFGRKMPTNFMMYLTISGKTV
jgi:pyruvate kinase